MGHDLTTQEGIAAACQSAEGQKAMMAVCDAASQGAWYREGHFVTWQAHEDERGGPDPLSDYDGREPVAREVELHDGAFIALARTALPLALAELARVTGEAERLREKLQEIADAENPEHYGNARDALHAIKLAAARFLDEGPDATGGEP